MNRPGWHIWNNSPPFTVPIPVNPSAPSLEDLGSTPFWETSVLQFWEVALRGDLYFQIIREQNIKGAMSLKINYHLKGRVPSSG